MGTVRAPASLALFMAMMHRGRRIDENQPEIVEALRKIGCFVMDLSGAGRGIMDLLVLYRGKAHMIEIKNPLKPKSDQSLTPAQIDLHALVAQAGCEIHIVRTIDEAIALVCR